MLRPPSSRLCTWLPIRPDPAGRRPSVERMHLLPGCEAATSRVVKGSRKNAGNGPKTRDQRRSYKFVTPSLADTGTGRRATRFAKRTRPFPSSSARFPHVLHAARRNRPPPPSHRPIRQTHKSLLDRHTNTPSQFPSPALQFLTD